MTLHEIAVSTPIYSSYRVQRIAGMFDVPLAERAEMKFSAELPDRNEPWTIGAIIGPSGSGKTTLARHAYGDVLSDEFSWPSDRAVIDCFGEHPLKEITNLLTAVGFSSPPAWVKPYAALSNGEQFRCRLARALLGETIAQENESRLIAFDEFTSMVDRTAAQLGSAAVSRAIRSKRIRARFVAITCHSDIVPWLEPDWVLDLATNRLERGRLRRPDLVCEVRQCRQALWSRFARHHYLSASLPRAATCFAAYRNGEPIAFCATCGMFGQTGRKRIARIVVLPEYQGLGLGMKLTERVAQFEAERGFRVSLTASHPSVIEHCRRSNLWRTLGVKRVAGVSHQFCHGLAVKTSAGRSTVSFEYVPSESEAHAAARTYPRCA